MTLRRWIGHVLPRGQWDYKTSGAQFTAGGNFNYGATCAVFFSKTQCQRGAGAAAIGTSLMNQAQGGSATSGPGNPFWGTMSNGAMDYGDQNTTSENLAVIAGYNYSQCMGNAHVTSY